MDKLKPDIRLYWDTKKLCSAKKKMIKRLIRYLGLGRDLPDTIAADLADGHYSPSILNAVLEAVSKQSGKPSDSIPIDWLLVDELELTYEDKRAVLTSIEQRLGVEVFDGIHCLRDFTTRDALEFYLTVANTKNAAEQDGAGQPTTRSAIS